MPSPIVRFEVVLLPAPESGRQVLRTLTDPNTATLAFQSVVAECQTRGEQGEVVLINRARGQTPVLRYPLPAPTSLPPS